MGISKKVGNKGGRLANEFSWSFSRHSTFSECQKKYWYTYYGSWEGWPKTPYDSRKSIDPLASYLYALKQMQQLPMFVGSCVHETIEHFLKARKLSSKKEPLQLNELIEFAESKFQKGLHDSKTEAWRAAPKKHRNLFEHYYSQEKDKDPFTEELVHTSREKISRCLNNWLESPIVKMAFDQRASWISIEELSHFMLKERYKILVVIDFALKWKQPNGKDAYILFDWKTGQETDKTEEQLYSYALFANRVLGAPVENIILSPFYLVSNKYCKIGYQQEREIEKERLEKLEVEIEKSCDAMASKLTTLIPDAEAPQPDPRLFPYTENRSLCPRCPFKEVCTKAGYQECSREELTALIR
jgi:hypothetical protein